jgi:hypothetical protein
VDSLHDRIIEQSQSFSLAGGWRATRGYPDGWHPWNLAAALLRTTAYATVGGHGWVAAIFDFSPWSLNLTGD